MQLRLKISVLNQFQIFMLVSRNFVLSFLLIISLKSSAQTSDTILATSEIIKLKYSPKTPVTEAKITFLKFKEDYGIQLSLLTPNKYIPHIFIDCIDSLVLILADGKKLTLDRPCLGTKYETLPNSHTFQQAYYIGYGQFQEFKRHRTVKIRTSHGCRPLSIRMKKVSQTKISDVAYLFGQ